MNYYIVIYVNTNSPKRELLGYRDNRLFDFYLKMSGYVRDRIAY